MNNEQFLRAIHEFAEAFNIDISKISAIDLDFYSARFYSIGASDRINWLRIFVYTKGLVDKYYKEENILEVDNFGLIKHKKEE